MPQLVGPRLTSRAGAPSQLVVLLHGYCASGEQLMEIGRQWQPFLPDAVFVAPDAPEPCATSGSERQWFALTTREPAERWRGVTEAAPILDEFLDHALRAYGLADSQLALVGFSQGAEMALHVGLRRPRPPVAIIAFSGLLVGPEHLGEAAAARGASPPPPVLFVHGDKDEVIPVEAARASANQLAAAGIPCEWQVSAGLGHAFDAAGLKRGRLFLAECFDIQPPAS